MVIYPLELTWLSGDECERAKPDPLPYLIAMERLGLRPEETLVFEDSPSGAAAGVASGAVPASSSPGLRHAVRYHVQVSAA